jgi:kynurenine formamidase/glycosyltransferase involved in cell wall biosynthesis
MMTKTCCSIVIRCYNEGQHIGKLLNGIVQQTVDDVEIILVDSGSTDATLSIAARYPTKILTISPEEFSFGRALNLGCRAASNEFIVIASAHVYPVHQDWLERLLRPFAHPQVALVYGKQRGNEFTKYSEHQVFARWFPEQSDLRQDHHPFCNNANAAIRRSLWERLPYSEELTGLEDIDWAKRVIERGYYLAYAADAEVVHVHNETPRRIYNRYRREAIAMKRILPHEHFHLWDFIHLFVSNVVSDYYHALHERALWRNRLSIPLFRLMQFWGTYRGFAQHKPVTSQLKRIFYYPNNQPRRSAVVTRSEWDPCIEYSDNPREQHVDSIIDISVPLHPEMPVWPGSVGIRLSRTMSLEAGDMTNVSRLDCDVHIGTHVDAPLHFIEDGSSVEQMPLNILIGPALIAYLPGVDAITADDLAALSLPKSTQRLLLRTRNSLLWANGVNGFRTDYVALTADAARWIVEHDIRLVGVDYLSVQRYQDGSETHQILLDAGVVIVEGLNLADVVPGLYELICLPLKLVGAEGAPARAVLVRGEK